jgi:hypothetical protein
MGKLVDLDAFRQARAAEAVELWVVDADADMCKWVEPVRGHVVVAADAGEMADRGVVMTSAQARALGVALLAAAAVADRKEPPA